MHLELLVETQAWHIARLEQRLQKKEPAVLNLSGKHKKQEDLSFLDTPVSQMSGPEQQARKDLLNDQDQPRVSLRQGSQAAAES